MFQHQKRLNQNLLVTSAKKRKDLIVEHVSLIKYHAFRIANQLPPNVKTNHLISAGTLGLMKAVEKYEPSRWSTLRLMPSYASEGRC